MTLYRKWRPTVFTDVFGQDHITSVLKYEVANNRVNHAYLFCGSRGTGKTTCAKILSAAVNCEDPQNGDPCGKCPSCLSVRSGRASDVLEMDAASNTGVDYIRDIRDSVIYLPAELKYKVYIIDEVHMLSDSAFNALLKTLEEPPERVIFILATTEPHKIPTTILSRCQRFDFRRIPSPIIVKRLTQIAEAENIGLTESGARLIARLAEGGMRDSISLLELASAYGDTVDADAVARAAGVGGRSAVIGMVRAIAASDVSAMLNCMEQLNYSASDIAVFWQELIAYYRDMLIVRTLDEPERFIETTEEEMADLKQCAGLFTAEKLIRQSELLDKTYFDLRRGDSNKRVTAEMALMRMTSPELDSSNEALLERIAELERIIRSGGITVSAAPDPKPKPEPEPEPEPEQESEPEPEPKQEPEQEPEPVRQGSKTKIANWGNIVDKVDKPMISMYLIDAAAYYDEATHTVDIICGDQYKADYISDPESIEVIRKALAAANAKYIDCRITVTLSAGTGGADSHDMDQFIV